MIEIPFRRLKISIHFSFFATVSLLMLTCGGEMTLIGLLACMLHECGHLAVMLAFGQPVKRLIFYGCGIKLVRGRNELLTKTWEDIFVLSAGCAVNFLLFALSGGSTFGMVNLAIGLFNLLPIKSLDGGKILLKALSACFGDGAEKFLNGANVLLTIVAAGAFFLSGTGNFTVYLTLAYLLVSTIS